MRPTEILSIYSVSENRNSNIQSMLEFLTQSAVSRLRTIRITCETMDVDLCIMLDEAGFFATCIEDELQFEYRVNMDNLSNKHIRHIAMKAKKNRK